MKCSNCGTTNGKTNKFCRECGMRLENNLEQALADAPEQAAAVCAPDEVALGELLYHAMKRYESGDLEEAVGSVEQIIACNPDSASAHSILALIYERKADREVALGDQESARQLLQQAVYEYERIIDLNPDSAADREKLVNLRMRLAGQIVARSAEKAAPTAGARERVVAIIKTIPPPALAAAGAFFVILVLGIVLIPGGQKQQPKVAVSQSKSADERIRVIATPSSGQDPSSLSGTRTASGGVNVYTYPTPSSSASTPAPVSVLTKEPARTPSLAPMKLPALGPGLTIVSEAAKPAKSLSVAKAKTTPVAPAVSSQPVQEVIPAVADGATLLARSIMLANQDRYQDAIQTAQQASDAFRADVAAGRNVTAAQRGVDTAAKYVQLWRASIGS